MTKKKEKYDLVAERCMGKNTRLKVKIPGLCCYPWQHTCGQVTSLLASFGLSGSIGCSTQSAQPSCTEYLEKLLKQKGKVDPLGDKGTFLACLLRRRSGPHQDNSLEKLKRLLKSLQVRLILPAPSDKAAKTAGPGVPHQSSS